ncbi:MAG: SPOR domain-containing protein [Hyphomicrobiaceae bacterium]
MSPSLPRIVLSLAIALPCIVGGIEGAEAQRASSSKAAASKGAPAGNETDRVLDGAAKALEAGNADAAMTALDGVLTGGGLSNAHMARALYLRGLAHRKKGRPAQAMADLTSAIWLKDGLNEKDRNAALSARSEVAREAGVAAPATGGSGAPAAPAAPAESRPATTPAAPRTRTVAGPPPMGDALSEAGFTRGFSTPAPAPEPQVRSAPAGTATSSWQSTTTVDAKERRRPAEPRQQVSAASPPAPRPPPAPAEANPPASQPNSGGGLGSFLSGLFTGGAPAPTSAPSGDAGGKSQWRPRTERWETTEKPAEPKAGKSASPISTSAVTTGAYRLQIATVRSRKEADAVAARVRKEHANAISGRRLEVDETVFGGMGTFYRVRLGPYADVKEPKLLCEELRPKGYDCLVVTN